MFFRKKQPSQPAGEAQGSDAQPRYGLRSPSDAIKPTMALPPPPGRIRRRRGGFLGLFSAFLTFLVIGAGVGIFAFTALQREVTEKGPLQADKVVLIPKNIGTSEIAELLKREGVIERPGLFEAYALLNRSRGQLKAGEFLFKAGVSVDEAIDTLAAGKPILHAITIPEGLTSEQIVGRLNDNDVLVGTLADMPREGSLMPDTYKFERGMTRQQIVNAMQAAQKQALNQIWQRRSSELPFRSPDELVIMASIVEKETGRADERTRVAGVFINRLGKRMKLQSDPTIVYGLAGGKGTLGRGIQKAEIDKPTAYNTYVIEGMPPGPIANPGRAALEAAANPSRTKDIYFVADGSGGHVFAETYDQHLRNVTRWRQIERARATPDPQTNVDRIEPDSRSEPLGPNLPTGTAAFTNGDVPAAGGAKPGIRPPPGRRAVDASEGTARDPLLNKTYDLNSPKTVPPLKRP